MEAQKYIDPIFIQSDSIEGINEYINRVPNNYSLFEKKPQRYREVLFKDLANLNRVIIIGEPGCGKSRLIQQYSEYCKNKQSKSFNITLKECNFDEQTNKIKNFINENKETKSFIFLDALDEVNEAAFPFAIKFISELAQSCKEVNIWFTCREYYVMRNIYQFNQLTEFQYLLIDNFDQKRILDFVEQNINDKEKQKVFSDILKTEETGKSLLSVFKIPRYLKEVCALVQDNTVPKEKIQSWKRTDYFEKAIYSKLLHEENNKLPNGTDIAKRVLEKIALIMEIKRTNSISYDELITILDEIKSNISITFLSFYPIEQFIERVLKRTGNQIEFENTEFQEYLAAKEVLRMKSPEQVLYDFMVNTDFNHIYDNWFDVLGYIVELNPKILFYVADLVTQKQNQLSDNRIFKLIFYADLSELGEPEKEKLFSVYYTYFTTHRASIAEYTDILTKLYMPDMYNQYLKPLTKSEEDTKSHFKTFNEVQLVTDLIKQKKLTEVQKTDQINNFSWIIKHYKENNNKITVLNALGDLSEKEALFKFKSFIHSKDEKLVRCYISNLSKTCPNNDMTIKLSFERLSKGYSEGKNEIMKIDDPKKIHSAYNKILNSTTIFTNFFKEDFDILGYYNIHQQLKKVYDEFSQRKAINLGFKLLKSIVIPNQYNIGYQLQELCKDIIYFLRKRDEKLVSKLLSLFNDCYILDDMLWVFVPIITINDFKIIKSHVNKMGHLNGDYILQRILQQIKNSNNPKKEEIYEEGRKFYSEIYQSWESPTPKKETNPTIELLEKAEFEKGDLNKCFQIFKLTDKLSEDEFANLSDETIEKLVLTITTLIDIIDLDKFKAKQTETSISFNCWLIPYLPQYIRILCKLGKTELIKNKYRLLIIKFLPIYIDYKNNSQKDIDFLFAIIGDISSKEATYLFNWLYQRDDDYLKIAPEELFKVIQHFQLSQFSVFVKRFIEPDYNDSYIMKEALNLLMEDFMNPEEPVLEEIFSKTPPNDIKNQSIEALANFYLISKFNDKIAAEWRINYIKEHVYEFDLYNHEGMRFMSSEETEMSQLTMCNCFYNNPQANYKDLFLDLIDHSLTVNTEKKYSKYAEYVQRMSIDYFKKINNKNYIQEIAQLINKNSNKTAVAQFMPFLREAQIYITNQINIPEIQEAIEIYNKMLSARYIPIKNEQDLFYATEKVISNFINVIENEGLYRLIKENSLREDLIQKTLKVAFINEFLKLGLRNIDIDREVNLYDNKRTDILIKYGFIGPIMIELKLLHNIEIQNPNKRKEYKTKLKQYIAGTYAKHSYYIIFKVKPDKDNKDTICQFNEMGKEYSDINNLKTILIDCLKPNYKK